MKTESLTAFPINESPENGIGNYNVQRGLTIRDYFAAVALQGILSNPAHEYVSGENFATRMVAGDAYLIADAMIQERNK